MNILNQRGSSDNMLMTAVLAVIFIVVGAQIVGTVVTPFYQVTTVVNETLTSPTTKLACYQTWNNASIVVWNGSDLSGGVGGLGILPSTNYSVTEEPASLNITDLRWYGKPLKVTYPCAAAENDRGLAQLLGPFIAMLVLLGGLAIAAVLVLAVKL